MSDEVPYVSQEAARKVLARAATLDEGRRNALTLAQLREAALEAGISAAAFEAAIAEHHRQAAIPKPQGSFGRRLWQRLRGDAEGNDPRDGLVDSIVANLASFAVFWFMFGIVSRSSRSIGLEWQVSHLLTALTALLGVGVSLRLRGRVTAIIIGALGAAALAEYPMHLIFGIHTVQGGPTKWAGMLAALLGVGVGVWWSRAASSSSGRPATEGVEAAVARDRPEDTPGQLSFQAP